MVNRHNEDENFQTMANRNGLQLGRCSSCDLTHSSELRQASWLSFGAAFGAGWPTFTLGPARACFARIDRRVAGEQQACLRTSMMVGPFFMCFSGC